MDNKSAIAIVIAAIVLAVGFAWPQPSSQVGVPGVNLIPSQGEQRVITLDVDTDYTLTHAESGSVIVASTTNGTTTLPAVREGVWYVFQVGQAIATGNWIIDSAEGDNIEGSLIVAGAVVDCDAEDQINFVTDGENLGDYVVVRGVGSKWLIEDSGALTSAKLTCTDPS